MPKLAVPIEKSVFISHASKDKEIADAFVDIIMHGAMSIDLNEIFCTSTEGTRIKSGEDWRNSIKASLLSSKVTLLIITPHYKESEICLNEMGAAWVLSSLVLPTIVEPITFKTVGVIPEVTQIEKLLEDAGLDRIRDRVQSALSIPADRIASDRWSIKKLEFIRRAQKHISENPFSAPIERSTFDSLIKEKAGFEKSLNAVFDEKQNLEQQIKALEKTKDAKEVKAIKAKFHPSSEYDEFSDITKRITQCLRPFKPIIRGVIFKTFNSKPTNFDWQIYKQEIEEADALDYINIDSDDGSLEADWDTTIEMRKLFATLKELEKFMSKPPSETFDEQYNENHPAPFKIDNKSFWDQVFVLPIYLS